MRRALERNVTLDFGKTLHRRVPRRLRNRWRSDRVDWSAPAGPPIMRFIEIEQVRSPIRRECSQRKTLIGLGLNRIGRSRWVRDTPSFRGMIEKVSHLVKIKHDPAAHKPPAPSPAYDETADAALMSELAFDGHNIVPEKLPKGSGKTPDFKLVRDGVVCGFCEMKSPRDDYIFEKPEPEEFVIRENLPYYVKLGRLIRKVGSQFAAANPERAHPNILAFVNHAPEIERRDLHATILGLQDPGGRPVYLIPRELREQMWKAAREIDLFLWIDAEKGTLQHVSVNGAPHQQAVLDLLGLTKEEP
jgi:large subunit ribosomal protein L30